MAHFEKHFTLQEANSLLPRVQSIFIEVHLILDEAAHEAHVQMQNPTQGGSHAHNGNGHRHKKGQSAPSMGNLHAPEGVPENLAEPLAKRHTWADLNRPDKIALVNQLLQSLLDRGIVIQDIERGLIDFPAWRNGEEVMLCYEMGDGPDIGFWHDLESGFAGRQPIGDWPD